MAKSTEFSYSEGGGDVFVTGDGEAPYRLSLDPDSARQLAEKGGSLLFLDVPHGTSVGLDTEMFMVGPKFGGFKMIPPGVHFIYYSAANRHGGDCAPVIGFFVHVESSQVIVRQWDKVEERLVKLIDNDEAHRYEAAVRRFEFDACLAPYNLNRWRDWRELTSFISALVIEKHEPMGGDICLAHEADAARVRPATPAEKQLDEYILRGRERSHARRGGGLHRHQCAAMEGDTEGGGEAGGGGEKGREGSCASDAVADSHCGRATYTSFPRFVRSSDVSPADLTAMNMDKSRILEKVISDTYGSNENMLIGEFQFAFIAFLMGQSLDGFRQWKSIIHLMTGCIDGPVRTQTQLFTKFTRTFYFHLRQGLLSGQERREGGGAVVGMDELWLSDDNFLKFSLKYFFRTIGDAEVVDGDLLNETKRLGSLLQNTLGWDFDQKNELEGLLEEEDEYAPVVVSVDSS